MQIRDEIDIEMISISFRFSFFDTQISNLDMQKKLVSCLDFSEFLYFLCLLCNFQTESQTFADIFVRNISWIRQN